MKVAVLGVSGMLGSMVLDIFSQEKNIQTIGTVRGGTPIQFPDGVQQRHLDAELATTQEVASLLEGVDWVINCIGVIKYHIHDDNHGESERAIRVNSLFPHVLAEAATRTGSRVLQIATDCVYSGSKGSYLETDPHDALDVYGKTKSLGEVPTDGFYNLRCSIIGPERKEKQSLLEWFLGQPRGGAVMGYTNHYWNGVTTLHFAKLCLGIIGGSVKMPGHTHVLPADVLSKADLLHSFAMFFGRKDLAIAARPVPQSVDRSLGTLDPDLNLRIWQAAGYLEPPTLALMVEELAQYIHSRGGAF